MASTLGSGANPSLGFAIGLQATPDTKGYDLAAQGLATINAKKQRDALAKKKSDDGLKDLGNYKIPVVNPIYQGGLEKSVGELHNTLYDLAKTNDPDAMWKGQAAAEKTDFNAKAAQESTKNADIVNQTRYAAANNKNVEPTDFAKKFFEEYDKSVAQKSPTDEFKKMVGNDQGFIPQSVTQQLYQPKKVSLTQYAPKYAKDLGLTSYKTEKDKGDIFETISGKGITPKEVKDDIRQTILANDAEGKAILANYGAGVDVNAAVEGFYDLVKHKIPSVSSQTLTQKSTGGSTKEQIDQAKSTVQEYNAGQTTSGEKKTIVAKGNLTFKKPLAVTVSIPKGTINGKDFTNVENTGVDKNVSLGGMQNLPVYKGTDDVVPTEALEILKKKGMGNKVEYKTYVPASSTEKVIDQATGKETPSTESYLFPLKAVKPTIEKNGESKSANAFESEAEKLTKELQGEESVPAKEQPKKKDAKHYGL